VTAPAIGDSASESPDQLKTPSMDDDGVVVIGKAERKPHGLQVNEVAHRRPMPCLDQLHQIARILGPARIADLQEIRCTCQVLSVSPTRVVELKSINPVTVSSSSFITFGGQISP
jgi:hypothetical protein